MIYSIFYISVASSIRNYGQLRTIGTTKRQIKKMVYREGKLLAAIGIPIGLVIGNVIGYFLVPDGWYWLTTFGVTVGVGLFAFIIVMLSIRTPVKKAAAVSPMEALRYFDYQGKMKESSVLHRNITPASLAKMNLSRQKTKSILTILSLSLGGVLVVLISTMLISYDGVAETRGKEFPVGEFNIQLNANQSWDTADVSLAGLQQKDLLNADFENAIESMDGVTGTKRWYYTDAEYRVNDYDDNWIYGLAKEDVSALKENLIAGTVDYHELVSKNGIILIQDTAENLSLSAQLGDSVEVDFLTKSGKTITKSYTIMGIVSNFSRNQQLPFGALLIVAIIVVCFSFINLVNTTITNFLSRRQEIGMLQAIGLSKKQLIRMLCYEGLIYSAFATLVTLLLGAGLGFLCVQAVKTMNPYFYYSFPWLVAWIYLGLLLIVQFILISYTTGNLKKQSLVEQIRTTE